MCRLRSRVAAASLFLLIATGAGADSVVYTPSLSAGWNLIGNSLTSSLDVKALYGDASKFINVWKWDASSAGWQFYAPSLDAAGTLASYAAQKGYGVLSTIAPGDGYWVNVASTGGESLASQSGTGYDLGAARLVKGWNLVATGNNPTPADFNRALSGAASGTPANLTTLWAWDTSAGNWRFYAPEFDSAGTLASYIKTRGYLEFGATTLGQGRGFWANYPASTSCVLTPTWENTSTSLLSGRVKVTFENTTGASSKKGLKQRFLLENTSSAPLYLGLDGSSPQGRIMLMAPQPSVVYLPAGGNFQGMLIFEASSSASAGSNSYTVTLAVRQMNLSTSGGMGAAENATRDVTFTLLANDQAQPSVSSASLSYSRIKQVNTKTGFWTYAVDAADSKIVLFPGQETWTDESAAAQSTIYAYSLAGTLLWQVASGAQTWGGDMSADGKYVAYATTYAAMTPSSGENLVLLDGNSGSELWRLALTSSNFPAAVNAFLPSSAQVREVRFSPSGQYLAIATIQGKVYLLDRATKTVLWGFETFGQVRALSFSADETMLYAGAGDGYLHKLAVANGSRQWQSYIVAWPYAPGALSPDGATIVTGAKTGEMVALDTSTGACRASYDFGIMTVRKTLFSPDGKHLLVVSGAPAGSISFATSNWGAEWSTSMSAGAAITADSAYALIADGRGAVLDLQTGQSVAELNPGFASDASYFKVVYISRDGTQAVIARRDTSPDAVNIAFFRRN